MSEPTKPPWSAIGPQIVDEGMKIIAICRQAKPLNTMIARDNAAFIVQACNSFDELIEACKAAQAAMGMHGPCRQNSCKDCKAAWTKLREAIAKAEGISNAPSP